ncbi:MAG TPA: SDR family oxidoreductase [Nitrososphaerales archaeon]|nr:SDR family oxidoreductase [Nitrososphaerales archaeon]
MELEGRVAIVTGAGSGMGRTFSLLFAKEGAKVMAVDINQASGEETVRMIRERGGEAAFVIGDVSKSAGAEGAVKACVERFGRLDILMNNAGIQFMGTILETSEDQWDKIMAVNTKSMFLMSKYAVPAMAKGGKGVILNMGSDAGLIGNPKTAAYCASKGAVIALTRSMALDHAPDGIRVNCICPGAIDTPLHVQVMNELSPEERDAWKARVKVRYPLGRIGTPDEVANLVLFLASDKSSFMTGAAVSIDGGLTAQ